MRLLILTAALAGTAHADTLGLLPCTQEAATFVSRKDVGAPRLIVARDPASWQAAWTATRHPGKPPLVDWNGQMVVGIINGPKADRVIYRLQLDSAETPTALVVHVSTADSPCGTQRTPAGARAQLVVTARSALPVRFVEDAMIDGGLFGVNSSTDGVESHELGSVAGLAPTPAATREAAEHLVFAALTVEQKKELLVGPLGQPLARIPHGWTRVHVVPGASTWQVDYDELHFTVDLALGTATLRP